MTLREILTDIHALEEDLIAFERKYGLRSETFFAAYMSGEEPEDESWVLDFAEWASVYRTWLARQAEYRNEVQRLQRKWPEPRWIDSGGCMSEHFRTPEDYELFLYTVAEHVIKVRVKLQAFRVQPLGCCPRNRKLKLEL